MKVILCGYHWIGCQALELLKSAGHEVFVFTHKNPVHVESLTDYCQSESIPFSSEKITIENLPFIPDLICSIYYRYKISKEVINICNGKIFNLHPSLLPKYRGCSSLTWAIINGEKEVGFTYHYIDESIDTGNVILQKSIRLSNYDTQRSIYYRIMYESMTLFETVLNKVAEGDTGEIQCGTSSYYPRGCPYDGEIKDEWEPEKIERFIRAMSYPPMPYAHYKGVEVKSMAEFLKLKK